MTKRVLVAGGAGFIGAKVVSQLLGLNHEVIVADNFSTGRKSNLESFLSSNLEVIRHDINFPLYVEVDAVINLASPASPVAYQTDPVQTIKTNVVGSVNLLGLAKRLSVPILQASTSEVYGDPEVSPQREDYWGNVNPIGIRSCYDEGKRAAETLFFDYKRQHGLKIGVARIFNTYGPHMSVGDGRVVSNFIVQALSGQPLTIYGDGTQTRSFCYVDDTVDGLLKLWEKQGEFSGPVNIGNPNEITILELAETVANLTGVKVKLEHKELPESDPVRRKPDISLAKKELNWEPKVSLEAGLKNTIEYFDKELSKASR
jgi:UDP-glucuronate decarboxylase